MVPVELRLTNFLSYGTAAPPLDFEQFHVACLSGRNGQGKSALLDAITWALWGEGRKSSDNRKPDADLIRIGAQRMQVEFVFDLEGERYRVVRAYTESASGKTSRPELEFHVYEAGTGQYRPLTAGSLRETQAQIDRVLGIDYETFINSSFLLQGRSDEFTKKRPSERKQILARILNLGKYDRLADRARQREREAAERVQRAEAEIERLKAALEPEASWRAEEAAVREQIEAAGARLEGARQAETGLAEQLATLEARAREAEGVRTALRKLDEERAAREADARTLQQRIEQAEALLARSEQIQRDYDRYEALTRERDDLHTRGELYRGFDAQLSQKEADLKDRRTELEKQIDRFRHTLETHRAALSEAIARLGQREPVRAEVKAAREARDRLGALEDVRRRREALEQRRQQCQSRLIEAESQLKGRLQSLQGQIEREVAHLPDREALERECDRLERAAAERADVESRLERTTQEGQQIREAMEKLRGQIESREEEQARLQEDLDRLHRVDVCPTCGSDLTGPHRAEVAARLQGQIDAIAEAVASMRQALERRAAERLRLREAYQTLKARLAQLEGVREDLG
ncbi:MAG: SMC family ATPase, partial [Bacteroidetes bacterium]